MPKDPRSLATLGEPRRPRLGFVGFILFWDMLLPIARDGAPFRASASLTPEGVVAPNWVWILGFTLMGLIVGACYAALRGSLLPLADHARNDFG